MLLWTKNKKCSGLYPGFRSTIKSTSRNIDYKYRSIIHYLLRTVCNHCGRVYIYRLAAIYRYNIYHIYSSPYGKHNAQKTDVVQSSRENV
jgi:hypothetical protein